MYNQRHETHICTERLVIEHIREAKFEEEEKSKQKQNKSTGILRIYQKIPQTISSKRIFHNQYTK